MSANSLQDLYVDELKDLWSANDQMTRVVTTMAQKAMDTGLAQALKQSSRKIQQHTETIRGLLGEAGTSLSPEHCRGMEGLVREATKHMTTDAPQNGQLCDLAIIAQYQRMSHYGIAGFGTAASYARALEQSEHAQKLESIVKEIYAGDHYATEMATRAEHAAAVAEAST